MSKLLCIYHNHCTDGFAAALAVRTALGKDNVEFFPGQYGKDAPDVVGRDVVMVDFSYKRDTILSMAKDAYSILIIDHHKSAKENLVDLPDNVTAIFDMDKSGAVLTWEHYHPDTLLPDLFKHIQDRDLWKFELEGTREILANLFSLPFDFDVWERLLSTDLDYLLQDGLAITRAHNKNVNELIDSLASRAVIAGYNVPVLNAPYMYSSDAGNIMAKGEPFAATYWFSPSGVTFSLRSSEDGVDVAKVAEMFPGGGGHKHAAGFKLKIDELDQIDIGVEIEID